MDELIEPESTDVGSQGELFRPTINEEDDILTKLIKVVVLEKGINLAQYKGKSNTDWIINNLKSNLIANKPMSYKYFIAWCDLLGLDFGITVNDNGQDRIAPIVNEYSIDTLSRIGIKYPGDIAQTPYEWEGLGHLPEDIDEEENNNF